MFNIYGETVHASIKFHISGEEWKHVEHINAYNEGIAASWESIKNISKEDRYQVYAIFESHDKYTIAPRQVWFMGEPFSRVSDSKQTGYGQLIKVGNWYYSN